MQSITSDNIKDLKYDNEPMDVRHQILTKCFLGEEKKSLSYLILLFLLVIFCVLIYPFDFIKKYSQNTVFIVKIVIFMIVLILLHILV